ncbi:Putative ABC-type amino acid transport/signal transduction systems, periplasmic component/domain [Nostocoides japonicum T1-X7]|uniref:Putative ABC-type amino acid transport/signal transduction systems, periplasmic component/domain n=1 Tax=Nostocoides japonicum T1-X7 TaxID=1194083 RepID=A0A077M885_9MICO|nr:transporter substrate-binding domain-containing protein [Tetrasphaera japonica]CCH80230.1 Putative ABC-type amino acid transport/signal transduction systems, periplasmic component/domain [Tetrasphaera japonica T1-X7]
MKFTSISFAAVACLALGVTAGCSSSGDDSGGGSNASAGATNSSATGTTGNIAEGVSADPASVALLPASIKTKGAITVAMDLQYPPTSFLNTSNQPVGFNVDISRLLAAKLGLKLNIENVSFSTIIPGITGGRYDFTATDMSATPERLKVLDMINYWSDGSSLGVKAGNPDHLNINDSSVCGKSIAVMTGSTQQETYLPALSKNCTSSGKPAIKTVVLPNVNTALTQLSSGRINGIFYDTPSLAWAVQEHGSAFAVTADQYDKPASLGNDLVALGLAKDSPLTAAMQKAMQSIIDSPLYLKALNNWGLGGGAIKTADKASATSS